MLSQLEMLRRHLVISSVLLVLIPVLAVTALVDSHLVDERVPVAVAAASRSAAVPAAPSGSVEFPANATDDTHVVVIAGVVEDCLTGRGVPDETVRIRELPSATTVTDREGIYTLVAQLALPAEYTVEITSPRYFSPRVKSTGVIQPASQGETQVTVNFTGADCQPPKPTPSAPPVDARITLEPLNAINEVNQPHTITATVEIKDQWGWTTAPDGTPVTFSLRNNTAGANFVGSNVCTTVNGACSVAINAGSAGRVDVHAATDITAGSAVLHRETDGTGGNSGDAHKVYVDARIRVEPLEDTNEVDEPHPVTATVEVNDGDGWRIAPDGTPVTFSLLNNTAQAVFVDGESCVTSFGSCAITINTDTAGSVDIRASTDVVVAGLTLTRTTGTGGLNSGDAHKVYVDGSIRIEPDGVNEVGTPHTFTVTVNADYGRGDGMQPAAALNPTVTLSPAPNNVTDNCATTGTDVNGQCTVTINSDTAGTFTANADVVLVLGGVPITRDTAGNSGPEGSGPATKIYVDARIRIEPSATNEVGQAHTFTVTVEQNDGSGWTPAEDENPTVTLSPQPDSVTDDCASAGTDVNGQCTVTINSDTAGTFTANAQITLSVAGVSVTRDTAGNSGPGGSGPATKTYVDASIRVEPSATNEVGTAHTFTVTVAKNDGTTWAPAEGETPTVTLNPTPGSVTDNCAATGTDANGQCTVVINSDTAGVFTANASASPIVSGVSIRRDTAGNSGPGGSGPANKRYVDANIRIEPSDINVVGDPHTFVVTVKADDGSGSGLQPAAGVNPEVTFDMPPPELTDNCATTGTDADGQCTVVINSDTAGTFTANTKIALAVGGVSVTRDTAGNSGPGGSGPATKTYLNASIRIEPSAANEVGTAHTFTVTVMADVDGGPQPVAGVTPSINVSPTPDSLTDNCAITGTDANGQCTVVINSDTAGTFTANASASPTVSGLSIRRDTAGNSGPGGSGPATKTYVDARIRIEPSATNEVGTAHTFTVTVEQNDGTGWVPADGENPTVSLSSVPSSLTDNCATTGTDADGRCTVAINSDVTGTFKANAQITLPVGGVSVTRDTAGNSGPGGSGPATKIYVDANIRIEPSAANEVGTSHTFTVTVQADDGSGSGLQPVEGVNPEVTFDTPPPALTDNCASTGTDANGQCTVTINSDTAGSFTANAKATIALDGASLTRDTAGNSGPGGSGPATKHYVDANIRIEPDGVNEVGTAHTFTVTVQADDGSGSGLQPVAGVNPEVAFDIAPPEVTDNCASAGTDAGGQCTVVINSDTAGTFTANAQITLPVGGVIVTRDTAGNSGPGGSGPATKTYVDANIRIEPSATNEVGQAHTFTVTVEQNDGTGWAPAEGENPTVSLSPAPDSVTDNCATTGTDADGQCTVVINSDVTGAFTANAQITLTLSGLSVTRNTAGNSGPGGSGPATKRYVDASIRIEPSAVNTVGEPHTFTVTVQADDGSGGGLQPVAGVNPEVTFDVTPPEVTGNCASAGTDADGQCTVVINSDIAGTFTANAKTTLTVGGVDVTRDTAGNSGPGGSGPATKRYVDASIRIEPSAVNTVGEPHTFTVTVQADDGRGGGLQPVEGVNPEVTFDVTPPEVTDNCASAGTDADGQCTVVINSDTAGTFTANAKITLSVDGVSVTRDTAGDSGPGGSGPATKRYVQPDANIRIEPSATNEVGTPHTFTVTVKLDDGRGGGLQPVAGVNPTVTVSPAPGSLTDNCASTGTNADGQCTVVINSDKPGTFTANAKITLTVDWLSMTRDTAGDSGPGGSGPATKTYVDANVSITPDPTNEVGDPHTFIVTVEKNVGAGWMPAQGEHPTAVWNPMPDIVEDNCATTGTDADGQCTVTINSDTAGTFTANARITLSIDGASITRDTAGNSGPGGSGSTAKIYVDATVSVEPNVTTATGDTQTFTVTVLQDDGRGSGPQPAQGVKPVVSLSPPPSEVTDNCATLGTDANGQCTVVVHSGEGETFEVYAAISLPVGELYVIRDSAGNKRLPTDGHARLRPGVSSLNMRSDAGVENPVVGYVLPDNVLIVQDDPQLVAGDPWYPVFNATRDVEGWVNGRYLVPQPAP